MAWHGMAKRQRQSQALRSNEGQAPGKKRNLHVLVAEIHKEDQDISAKALEALWKLQHFNEYPIQDKF